MALQLRSHDRRAVGRRRGAGRAGGDRRAVVKGGNYGWRVYEGFRCTNNEPSLCNPSNYIAPVFDYGHTGGRCSVTGRYVYRGSRGTLPAGTYVYGDFCSGEIFAWNGRRRALLIDTAMNISSFGEDEQGELYVVNLGGTVSRIESMPETCTYTFSPAGDRRRDCLPAVP